MQAFTVNQTTPRTNSRRLLIPAVGILLIGGAAFVAAGGVALVQSWFVTTTVNGQVVDTRAVTPNEDGSATFTIPVGPPQEGTKTVELAISGDEGTADGAKTVNISLDGNAGEAQVEIKTEQTEGGE